MGAIVPTCEKRMNRSAGLVCNKIITKCFVLKVCEESSLNFQLVFLWFLHNITHTYIVCYSKVGITVRFVI